MDVKFFSDKRMQRSLAGSMMAGICLAMLNGRHNHIEYRFTHSIHPAYGPTADDFVQTTILGKFVGWPASVPTDTNWASSSFISAITANLWIAMLLCLLAAAFTYLIHSLARAVASKIATFGRARYDSKRSRTNRSSIAVPLSICVVGTVGLSYPWLHQVKREKAMSAELSRFGNVEFAIDLPEFLSGSVPVSLLRNSAKIKRVSLSSAPNELIDSLCHVENLVELRLDKVVVDVPMWLKLTQLSSIESLTFSRCQFLTTELPIAELQSPLKSLALNDCSGAETIMKSIPRLTALTSLQLAGTPMTVNDLNHIAFPESLKHVQLTIDVSAGDSIAVAGMKTWESLRIHTTSKIPHAKIISLELRDLCQLEKLAIDSNLGIDLTIENASRLNSIVATPLTRRFSNFGPGSGYLAVRSLTIDQAPCIQELRLNGSVLERFSIQRTPNLHAFIIGSEWADNEDEILVDATVQFNHRDRVETIDQWISCLAACDGPTSLNLSQVSLVDVDLAPLSRNQKIKELVFPQTGVTAQQLARISHNGRIKSLRLNGSKIDNADLQLLFASYEGIEQLIVDTDKLEKLEVVDQPRLRELFHTTTRNATVVKIVGCPLLTGALSLGSTLVSLEVRDVPSLKELTCRGPLPTNAVLEGLRDLEVVEIGGPNISDDHFRALLNCRTLRELTLIMPPTLPSLLEEVNQFSELQVLRLPGSQVNDQVVLSWDNLQHLREVNLKHTDVGNAVMEWLPQLANLQNLSISNTKIQLSVPSPLLKMKSLVELDMASLTSSTEFLQNLLTLPFIDRVNLSGIKLNDDVIELLASQQADHLRFAGLRRCGLSDDDLNRIASANPQLAMDIEDNDISPAIIATLAKDGRLISCQDRSGFELWVQYMNHRPPGIKSKTQAVRMTSDLGMSTRTQRFNERQRLSHALPRKRDRVSDANDKHHVD